MKKHKGVMRCLLPILILLMMIQPLYGVDGKTLLFSRKDLRIKGVKIKGDKEGTLNIEDSPGIGDGMLNVTLEKGKDLYITKGTDIDISGKTLLFTVKVNKINRIGGDYEIRKSRYPFFLLMIFDEGPGDLSLKKRVVHWIKALWSEKVSIKKELIYAFANRLPSDSIITPEPGSAVISIGDEKDVRQPILVERNIEKDLTIAFGEKGNVRVKEIVLGFESGEDVGNISVNLSQIYLVKKK